MVLRWVPSAKPAPALILRNHLLRYLAGLALIVWTVWSHPSIAPLGDWWIPGCLKNQDVICRAHWVDAVQVPIGIYLDYIAVMGIVSSGYHVDLIKDWNIKYCLDQLIDSMYFYMVQHHCNSRLKHACLILNSETRIKILHVFKESPVEKD